MNGVITVIALEGCCWRLHGGVGQGYVCELQAHGKVAACSGEAQHAT